MNRLSVPPIILASSSPRRRQLLEDAGFHHRVIKPAIDDATLTPGRVSPAQWILALAHLKARSVIETLPSPHHAIVIAADTLVIQDAQLMGQPKDAEDASRMITAMRDREHDVTTAVAYDTGQGIQWLTDTARVTVGHIPDAPIQRYVASGQWQGKAGAYNLSERVRDGWPIECKGDPTTVMGLPMQRLTPILTRALGDTARV